MIATKRKQQAEDICKETPDIEFEQDWSVGLDAMLRERQNIKNYFSSFKDFSGKNRWYRIVGLRIYYKHTTFKQNRRSHF